MEVTHAIPEQKPSEAEPGSHLHFPCPEICSVQVGTLARLASSPGTEGSEHSRHVRWARNKPLCLKATKVWELYIVPARVSLSYLIREGFQKAVQPLCV